MPSAPTPPVEPTASVRPTADPFSGKAAAAKVPRSVAELGTPRVTTLSRAVDAGPAESDGAEVVSSPKPNPIRADAAVELSGPITSVDLSVCTETAGSHAASSCGPPAPAFGPALRLPLSPALGLVLGPVPSGAVGTPGSVVNCRCNAEPSRGGPSRGVRTDGRPVADGVSVSRCAATPPDVTSSGAAARSDCADGRSGLASVGPSSAVGEASGRAGQVCPVGRTGTGGSGRAATISSAGSVAEPSTDSRPVVSVRGSPTL